MDGSERTNKLTEKQVRDMGISEDEMVSILTNMDEKDALFIIELYKEFNEDRPERELPQIPKVTLYSVPTNTGEEEDFEASHKKFKAIRVFLAKAKKKESDGKVLAFYNKMAEVTNEYLDICEFILYGHGCISKTVTVSEYYGLSELHLERNRFFFLAALFTTLLLPSGEHPRNPKFLIERDFETFFREHKYLTSRGRVSVGNSDIFEYIRQRYVPTIENLYKSQTAQYLGHSLDLLDSDELFRPPTAPFLLGSYLLTCKNELRAPGGGGPTYQVMKDWDGGRLIKFLLKYSRFKFQIFQNTRDNSYIEKRLGFNVSNPPQYEAVNIVPGLILSSVTVISNILRGLYQQILLIKAVRDSGERVLTYDEKCLLYGFNFLAKLKAENSREKKDDQKKIPGTYENMMTVVIDGITDDQYDNAETLGWRQEYPAFMCGNLEEFKEQLKFLLVDDRVTDMTTFHILAFEKLFSRGITDTIIAACSGVDTGIVTPQQARQLREASSKQPVASSQVIDSQSQSQQTFESSLPPVAEDEAQPMVVEDEGKGEEEDVALPPVAEDEAQPMVVEDEGKGEEEDVCESYCDPDNERKLDKELVGLQGGDDSFYSWALNYEPEPVPVPKYSFLNFSKGGKVFRKTKYKCKNRMSRKTKKMQRCRKSKKRRRVKKCVKSRKIIRRRT